MRWIHALVLALGLMVTPGISQAQIDNKINSMFNTMSNVTDPKIDMNARRGVITGGGVEIRNKNMNIQLWSFTPPSFEIGCNGISAFFGSFSFITKEQLQQAMKAIATAAVMYAFKIALAAMCPTCEQKLSELQGKMDEWNRGNINACQFATSMMEKSGAAGRIRETATGWGYATGLNKDREDAETRANRTTQTAKVAQRAPEEIKKQIFKGNQAWRAMNDNGLMTWAVGANATLLEDVMSYTGTVVACVPNVDDGCPARPTSNGGTETVITKPYAPSNLDIRTMIKGSKGGEGYKRWKCNEPRNCFSMTLEEVPNFVGIEEQMRNIFVGPMGTTGIVAKASTVQGSVPMTVQEAGWIRLGGRYAQMIVQLAKDNPQSARLFFNDFSEVMAAEAVSNLMMTYLEGLTAGLSQTASEGTEDMQKLAADAYTRLSDQRKSYRMVSQDLSAVYDYYNNLRQSANTVELTPTLTPPAKQ